MTTIPFQDPPFGYFPRPALTEEVRTRMVVLNGNIALFAPRRRGKTTWALLELQHAVAAWGRNFAYINLWENKSDPVGVLVNGLEAAAKIKAPTGAERELYAELGAGGSKVGGRIRYPAVTKERLDRLKAAVTALAGIKQRTILVIDEFQAIAKADKKAAAVAALRTALQHHGNQIRVLFTGSEASALKKLFTEKTAPLLIEAMSVDLPELGQDFVENRVEGLFRATSRKISFADAHAAYEELGLSPALLNQALGEFIVQPGLSLKDAAAWVIAKAGADNFRIWVPRLAALDRCVLQRVAAGTKPYADLPGLAKDAGIEAPLTATLVQAAMKRLEAAGAVESGTRGGWSIPDPALKGWLVKEAGADGEAAAPVPR